MFTRQYFLIPICYLVCNAKVNKHATLITLSFTFTRVHLHLAPTHLSYYSVLSTLTAAAAIIGGDEEARLRHLRRFGLHRTVRCPGRKKSNRRNFEFVKHRNCKAIWEILAPFNLWVSYFYDMTMHLF